MAAMLGVTGDQPTPFDDPSLGNVGVSSAVLCERKKRASDALGYNGLVQSWPELLRLAATIVSELAYGRAVDGFSAQEITDLLVPLAEAVPEAISPVYGVLSMYAFNEAARWNELRGAIRRVMLLPQFIQSLSEQEDHHWMTHCEAIFENGRDPQLATSLIAQIVAAEETDEASYSLDSTRKRVLSLLFLAHGNITWPIFGAGLLRKHEYRLTGLLSADDHSMMVAGRNTVDEAFSSPFWNLHSSVVIPWFQQHSSAVPAIFRSVALFVTEPDNTLSWHPLILPMLREFYKPEHASEIGSNLWSFGSTGSRVPYLQRRIKLLDSLRNEKKPALRALADKWADTLTRTSSRKSTAIPNERRAFGTGKLDM